MIHPVQIYRLLQIFLILSKHAFNRRVISKRARFLRFISYANPLSFRRKHQTRGESVRLAFESLGPIYVKFGQLLSTRFDLIPEDILIELEKLQDRVPPFDSKVAVAIVEDEFKKPVSDIYKTFDETPLASASISQVHAATLKTGEDVVVKILRPDIKKTIKHDISVLLLAAKLVERFWKHGKRLHPVALVNEFKKTTLDELDLMREAANASQLRRNFDNSPVIYVPQIYWDHTQNRVMTQERIYGVRISDIDTLKSVGTDMKKLAEYGVEIFFTQVFRDAFFHADMHPGNLFVDITDPKNPKYLGIDFGIMGTLSPVDQSYLAQNILAFLTQDYYRVAQLHIESGWVNPNTRVDEFESAIRTVCEPIFQKPLSEISFGQLLLRLFQTAERFQMEVQPQLMLLQKTLFYIESLGRKLYPNLDLWETAKPFMTRWMKEQRGVTSLGKLIAQNWHDTAEKIINTPELFFDVLHGIHKEKQQQLAITQEKQPSALKPFICGAVTAVAITIGVLHFF